MKTVVTLAALFIATLVAPALAEPASDLQARYMRSCMADGDSDSYCRCEYDVSRGIFSNEDLEQSLALEEAADDTTRQRMAEQMGQENFQRLFALIQRASKEGEARCRPANPRPAPR